MKYFQSIVIVMLFSSFFLQSELKEYYITCEPADFKMICDKSLEDIYIPITITYNTETWQDAEMRIRGETSRYFPKKSLKVKFNGTTFYNQKEEINLNAEYEDLSYVHSYLSSRIINEAGMTCFRTEHIRVYLNGKFLGLYLQVENVDKQFLEERLFDKRGNLYKASTDGSCLSKYDDVFKSWEKKIGATADRDDLQELIDLLNTVPDSSYFDFIKGIFDYENMISFFAINMLLSNQSTYYHNYYLYNDIQGSGKWSVFPWDLDKTFNYYGWGWNYSSMGYDGMPNNPLFKRALLCEPIFEDIKNKVIEVNNTIFNEGYLLPIIDSLIYDLELSVKEDSLDKVKSDLTEWNKSINDSKDFIKKRFNNLQYQFSHNPKTFKVSPLEEVYTGDVRVSWTKSTSDKTSNILYKIKYDTQADFKSGNVKTIENIKDTFFIITNLSNGEYYLKVEACNEFNCVLGYDSYNKFTKKTGTNLPCVILNDMILTKVNSPYLVNCDIWVQPGVNIVIEKGVEIRFNGEYKLELHGALSANGTEEEPIILRPAPGINKWDRLLIPSPTGKTDLSWVEFYNGFISLDNGIFTIKNVSIFINDNSIIDDAIYAEDATITVDNCYIKSNGITEGVIVFTSKLPRIENCVAINTADSYQFVQCENGIIKNNISIDAKDDGIDHNGCKNTVISGNMVISPKDKGISIGDDSWGMCENIMIEKNIFLDCPIGMELKDGSTITVRNNTLYNNKTGFRCFEKVPGTGGPVVDFVNNIISKSEIPFILENDTKINMSYSISDSDSLPGVGNIIGEPLFRDVTNRDFRLAENSPCIDAGDTNSPLDPDGTRADIGAVSFNQLPPRVVINEICYHPADDFDTKDWVEFYNADNKDIDISKWIFKDSDDFHSFEFPNGTILKKGSYLVLVEDMQSMEILFPDVKNVIGEMTFGFSGSGELLRLYDDKNNLIDFVEYSDSNPWVIEPDGNGPTLELVNPEMDNTKYENWKGSTSHGTPGKKNSVYDSSGIPGTLSADDIFKLIYPNPAKDFVYVVLNEKHSDYGIPVIYDVSGNRCSLSMTRQETEKGESQIMFLTKKLPIGKYFIGFENAGINKFESFVIIR